MQNSLTFFKIVSSSEYKSVYLFAIKPVIEEKFTKNIFSYYIMELNDDKTIHSLKRIENVSDYISTSGFDVMKIQEKSEEYLMIISILYNNINNLNYDDNEDNKYLKPLSETDNLNIKKATTRSF